MGTKQQKKLPTPRTKFDRSYRSKTNLQQRMSEIISLRERVTQAELAAHLYRLSIQHDPDAKQL
jgi:hypothetical protein